MKRWCGEVGRWKKWREEDDREEVKPEGKWEGGAAGSLKRRLRRVE